MSAGLGCGSTTIKYLLFFFNFLFALCGLLLVVLGTLSLHASAPLSQIGNHIGSSAMVLVIAGAIIFVIAFYGCCGAVRESHCMLVTFAVLLLAIIIVEVVACVLAFVYSSQAREEVEKGIHELFLRRDDKLAVEAVDYFQKNLQCCGENGPPEGPIMPQSCCPSNGHPCNTVTAYPNGCKVAIEDFIAKNGKIVSGVAIGVAVVELLGVWFALGLAGAIKTADRIGRY